MSDSKITSKPGAPQEFEEAENGVSIYKGQTGLAALTTDLGAVIAATAKVDLSKKTASAVNLNTGYLKFGEGTEGEEVRRQFLGMTKEMSIDPISGEEKGLVDAAVFYDPASGKIQTAMQSVIASNCKKLNPSTPEGPTFVAIVYIGTQKSKNGLYYQDFDIRTLND